MNNLTFFTVSTVTAWVEPMTAAKNHGRQDYNSFINWRICPLKSEHNERWGKFTSFCQGNGKKSYILTIGSWFTYALDV